MRSFKMLGALFLSFFMVLGLVPAAQAAATTGFVYTYTAKSNDPGTTILPTAKRIFRPLGGATYDNNECVKTTVGENSRIAFLETMVYGTYTASSQQGYYGYEDNELLLLAYYLHERLNGVASSKNDATGGSTYCIQPSWSNTGASITVQPPPGPALPLKANVSLNQRIYNLDNGSSTLYTTCRQTATGDGAIAAMFEVIKDGNYSSDFAGYLGSYDSDLVEMGIGLHRMFNGGSNVPNRGDFIFSGKPTCF